MGWKGAPGRDWRARSSQEESGSLPSLLSVFHGVVVAIHGYAFFLERRGAGEDMVFRYGRPYLGEGSEPRERSERAKQSEPEARNYAQRKLYNCT